MSQTVTDDHELREVVQELPDRFLECRMGNHRWKRQGDPVDEGGGTYIIRWRCPECRSRRFDRITRNGVLYARWYERPDGYDIAGFGHATREKAPYRAALIDRVEA